MDVDPFEARMEFLGLLGKLNATQHSILKVGNFAMRNRNLYEDLYSCITEELEKTTSINARMNIFYVLDSICQQSHKARFSGYTDLLQRNLSQVIEFVAPTGPKGNVNVAGTKKILDNWRIRKIFSASVIDKVERPLLSRELGANAPLTNEAGFSKDDILRRMDEDRERHKRIREEIWIRPPEEDPAGEFLQSWEEVSDIEDVDYEDMECENEKYLTGYPWILEFDRFLPSPALLRRKKSESSASTSSTTTSSEEPAPAPSIGAGSGSESQYLQPSPTSPSSSRPGQQSRAPLSSASSSTSLSSPSSNSSSTSGGGGGRETVATTAPPFQSSSTSSSSSSSSSHYRSAVLGHPQSVNGRTNTTVTLR